MFTNCHCLTISVVAVNTLILIVHIYIYTVVASTFARIACPYCFDDTFHKPWTIGQCTFLGAIDSIRPGASMTSVDG